MPTEFSPLGGLFANTRKKDLTSRLFKRQLHKMIKHTETTRQLLPTNSLSGFDYYKGLMCIKLGSKEILRSQKFIRTHHNNIQPPLQKYLSSTGAQSSRNKTSSRHLRIVLELSCLDNTFSRYLQDILELSCLDNTFPRYLQDIFM